MPWRSVSIVTAPAIAFALAQTPAAPLDADTLSPSVEAPSAGASQPADRNECGEHASSDR